MKIMQIGRNFINCQHIIRYLIYVLIIQCYFGISLMIGLTE